VTRKDKAVFSKRLEMMSPLLRKLCCQSEEKKIIKVLESFVYKFQYSTFHVNDIHDTFGKLIPKKFKIFNRFYGLSNC